MKVKKLLALLLTILFWSGSVQAVFGEASFGIDSAPYQRSGNGTITTTGFPKTSELGMEEEERKEEKELLPSSHDSRNLSVNGTSIITRPRNQGIYETCWAFAACSAAETSLLKKGILGKDTYLSPLQLSYFTYHMLNNPLQISLRDETKISSDFLYTGGNEYLAAFTMANWAGAAEETMVPYSLAESVYQSGLEGKYCFSRDIAHLENVYWTTLNDFTGTKEMILKYGSATTSLYMNEDFLSYNREKSCYYCVYDLFNEEDGKFTTNHQVTIVGWDDNYKKENFIIKPKGDGAWLVKNSWGTDWGKGGYFWLSYYDGSIYAEIDQKTYGNDVVFWDYNSVDQYDQNYYYDGGGGIFWWYFWEEDTREPEQAASMANVYEAQYEETLEAVSFFTLQDHIAYEIQIYTDIPSEGKPDDGKLVLCLEGEEEYSGYHTIPLPEKVLLDPGDRFAVAVKLDTQIEGTHVYLPSDGNGSWDWGVSFETNIKPGESYYLTDSRTEWTDAASVKLYVNNFRIKAFTKVVHGDISGDINFDGMVDAKDALVILKVAAGVDPLSYKMNQTGNVNEDEELNAMDALLVLKKASGMITDFISNKGE